MKLNSIPAEAAAWATGITVKNILTLTRRGILEGTKEPIGERKHSYFYNRNEVLFLAVLVNFQKQFSIKYRDSLKWKKDIIQAMNNDIPLLVINSDGKIEKVGEMIGGVATMIDYNRILTPNAVIFLNIKRLRRELEEKINSWRK